MFINLVRKFNCPTACRGVFEINLFAIDSYALTVFLNALKHPGHAMDKNWGRAYTPVEIQGLPAWMGYWSDSGEKAVSTICKRRPCS